MPAPQEFQSFECLALPVVVLCDGRVAYVNKAWARLLGQCQEAVVGLTEEEMAHGSVAHGDLAFIRELRAHWNPSGELPSHFWVRLPTVRGERLMQAIPSRGPRPGDLTFQFVDASAEANARAFTDALVDGAARLLVCRDEAQVWEIAVDTLASQGLTCVAFLLDAEGLHLKVGPVRQPDAISAAVVKYLGPLSDIRLPLERMRYVRGMFEQRRAVFHQDIYVAMQGLVPDGLLESLRPAFPKLRGAAAPVFVDDAPYGFVSARGPDLSPLLVATMELFARQVGNALENVRHHHLAAERLRQVEALQDELVSRERLAVLGEAAAVLAHEVRNPLGTIVNTAALIRRQGPSGVDASVPRMLEEEALRLDQLVHALLDFTRPIRSRPVVTSVGEVVQETVAIARRQGETSAVELVLELPPSAIVLETDAALLQIGLGNLLQNALQATPRGGQVTVLVQPETNGVSLRVTDEGPGVPESDHRRIFEPFYTTRAIGSGLGLPVVKRVASALGGTVTLEPSTGKGARFRLFIPDGTPTEG